MFHTASPLFWNGVCKTLNNSQIKWINQRLIKLLSKDITTSKFPFKRTTTDKDDKNYMVPVQFLFLSCIKEPDCIYSALICSWARLYRQHNPTYGTVFGTEKVHFRLSLFSLSTLQYGNVCLSPSSRVGKLTSLHMPLVLMKDTLLCKQSSK